MGIFLFILESIGTSELLLIGVVALIFLGPRKLPQIAKTIGKTLADFRNTTNEFKATWEREVNFEEQVSALKKFGEDDEDEKIGVPRTISSSSSSDDVTIEAPAIRSVDRTAFENVDQTEEVHANVQPADDSDLSDKRNWL